MANQIVRDLSGGRRCLSAVCSVDFASTATGAQSAGVVLDFPGARMTDIVTVRVIGGPTPIGRSFTGYVNANDQVTVYFNNASGGTLDLAATNYLVTVEGSEPVGGPL